VGALLLLAGCFQAFEDYRQLAVPARPPGASPVPPGPPAEVFPLPAGARFDYAARFGLGADGPFTGEAIVSVLDAWTEKGRESAAVRVVSRYFGRERVEPYVFVRDAAMIGLFEKHPPDKITWFMPPSLPADAAWKVETGEGTGEARVEAIEASVAVPAGTFRDVRRVRYANPGARTDITLWMAPRVGLVRAKVDMIVSVLTIKGTLELARYRLPRPD
jgi:hypothetical protein